MYARRRRSTPAWLKGCLSPWVMLGAFLIGIFLSCLVLGLLWSTRKPPVASAQATAILNVISAPTATQVVLTPTLEASATLPPGPAVGDIEVGVYVQILGTGGTGLRLRAEPGLEAQVLMVGSEAEVFRVEDGPQEADGYTWWRLIGPFDETRNGWAVANYLTVVQGP
ncbi:MAG: hypothetical protein AB1894_11910 [Chloroflexota bacterium]